MFKGQLYQQPIPENHKKLNIKTSLISANNIVGNSRL
jgi:hypothetical protein